MAGVQPNSYRVALRAQIKCPHCWEEFPPDRVYWISKHPELQPDPKLTGSSQERFLPTRFAVDGRAIDRKGSLCEQLACPHCHLLIPRALLEFEPAFVSILGAPSSGKTYFLASMMWRLRTTLLNRFAINFADADTESNLILTGYEETLFSTPHDNVLVELPKTEREGVLYETVNFGDRQISYPKPFVFTLKPLDSHPSFAKRARFSRALCLYDNAGEHFLPGQMPTTSMATHHLAYSQFLLFLFDPTQHRNFRIACGVEGAIDPQMDKHVQSYRQDLVLMEAANRIRNLVGLSHNAKTSRSLIVVVTKYDAWRSLLPESLGLDLDWILVDAEGFSALNLERLKRVSVSIRKVMQEYAPEVVNAADGFSEDVMYIPVSALGRSPELNKKTGRFAIRPKDIRPMWTEIPLLYGLHQASRGLVLSAKKRSDLQRKHASASAIEIATSEAIHDTSTTKDARS